VTKLVQILVDEIFGCYVHDVGDPFTNHTTTQSLSLLLSTPITVQ